MQYVPGNMYKKYWQSLHMPIINVDTYTCQCPNSHAHATMYNTDSANDMNAHDPTNASKCIYHPTSNTVAQIVGVSLQSPPHSTSLQQVSLWIGLTYPATTNRA